MTHEQSILDKVERQIRRHDHLVTEEYYTTCSLWPVGTFFVKRKDLKLFDCYPMLGFMSVEPDSGKTQALDVTAKLSFNSIDVGSYTPAVCLNKIDRAVAENKDAIITIPFDDLDTKMGYGKDTSDLVMLFNEGYRRGSVVSRCSRWADEDKDTPAFCPKCFSALSEARIPPATMTRTLAITMRPWTETDPPVLPDIDYQVLSGLNQSILEWSEREDTIQALRDVVFGDEITFLTNRNLQIWRPLLAIAKINGEQWYQRALKAAHFFTDAKQTSSRLPHRILAFSFRDFVRNRNAADLPQHKHSKMFHCGALAEELTEAGLIPKWVNGEKLAEFLSEYSLPGDPIHTRQLKISGRNRAGMDYHTLYSAWRTYLPELKTIMADEGLSGSDVQETLAEIGLGKVGEVAEVAVFTKVPGVISSGQYPALSLPSLPSLPATQGW